MAEAFWRLGQRHLWEPRPESLAARDQEEPSLVVADWDGVPQLGRMVTRTAVVLAVSANDHLHSTARLLSPPQRLWAAHSTIRGLLEAAARAWFISDPSTSAHERAR